MKRITVALFFSKTFVFMLLNKDIDKIQERSLSDMEKVHRTLDEYNKKNNLSLSLEEYLVKKLGIN
tara:strand:- start:1921 stop:2118 length:198 start_codon:yes stop_codon:yes gene_type:complete